MQASVQTDRSPSFALLRWYDAHARALPWRSPPATRSPPGAPRPDPYRVWLSEVMLQQTTVAAVKAYFVKFVERWPTVMALAAADEADVMAAWAGLGYYSRARNLIACAREVARLGAFPDTEAGLRALPGLGAYTAAAVAAIAFDRPAVVVDANVERVVARLFAIAQPLPAARPAIRAAAATITPATRPGDFAQAMMDLGATICTVRNPRCLLCPLRGSCRGEAAGLAETLPVKLAKKAKPHRTGHAWWIERDGMVWLVRRADKGMLGGMRALPDDGWNARADGHATPPFAGNWRLAGVVRHGFTHFDLDLQLMLCDAVEMVQPWQSAMVGEYWPIAAIEEAGLPTVFAKAARLALAER
jgi:A/G-specific adenine glycosylase